MAARGADERGRRSGSASRNAGVGARETRKREAAAAQFRYFWMLGVRLKNRAWAFLSQGEDEKKSEETETVRHVYS
jgi:hypothetical protein